MSETASKITARQLLVALTFLDDLASFEPWPVAKVVNANDAVARINEVAEAVRRRAREGIEAVARIEKGEDPDPFDARFSALREQVHELAEAIVDVVDGRLSYAQHKALRVMKETE